MKSRVRARSMTSRSTLVGQSHSKSAMGLNFLMADSRSRRSRLRRERSWVSSWASCSSSMRGDQRALVARARKSSRFAGMVFRPMCLSCASRSFIGIGLMVLVGELIVGLQIVRDDIERLQFWVATEIHRGGSGVLLRALPSAQDERHRRSTWCVALDCFPDGRTQLGGPVSIQELEELCGLAARRFSTCESGIEQSPMPMNDLLAQLKHIGLKTIPANLDDFLARATKARWSPRMLLEQLAQEETQERSRRSLERRLQLSAIKKFKPMADFEWDWPTKVEREVIERALTLDFIHEARNFVLVGQNGLGKTMIVQNICHLAVLAGCSVLFRTAAAIVEDLRHEMFEGRRRKLRGYSRADLLCIDELAYLSFDDKAADILYEVINRRYERRSVIV